MKYLLVFVLMLVGCTQAVVPSTSQSTGSSTSVATPTPVASPTCSPAGGTPRACSAEEYQKVQEQNRLTEEAIALYRRWTKESTRLYRAGGTNKATPEMLATLAGEYRRSALGVFKDLKDTRARAVVGGVEITKIGPNASVDVIAGTASITACLDGRSLRFERGGKTIARGSVAVEDVIAKQVAGQLRLWSVRSGKVKSC